jgi:hypothetical protein
MKNHFSLPVCLLPLLSFVCAEVSLPATIVSPEFFKHEAELRTQFTNPPNEFRILKIIHGWPDKPEQQDERIKKLQGQGFGGVVCNVAFDGGYVESEAKWSSFLRGVKEAKKAGMAMWLYDEKGYPSGNAGGIVMRDHPEWEARGLLIAQVETSGTNVVLTAPPGKVVVAAAFPLGAEGVELARRRDLSSGFQGDKLAWQPPTGRWRVMIITESKLYEGTHAAANLYAHIPYPNLLLRETTARFLEVTHDQYAKRLDTDLGKWFMGTFTDEPSLMSAFLTPMPYRVLPWSQDFEKEFRKRRGYALSPWLPLLMGEGGPQGMKTRYDFWQTVGELVAQNYFGLIQKWCAKHNIPSGGHALFEENLLMQVASYGDFFRCIRRLDAPSIDCLTSLPPDVPWYIARLLASAGDLTGKRLVMSETSDHAQHYRPPNDKRPIRVVTEEEMRGTFNRQLVGGVNCFTSYYSYQGLADEQIRRLNEYVGRCCLLLREPMHRAANIALVYPTESLWVRFKPSSHYTRDSVEAQQVADTYRHTAEALYTHAQDFSIMDAQALIEAKVEGDKLQHGALSWNVVVLPQVDTLPMAAWVKLAGFVKSGGVVISLGQLPTNSEKEFPSTQVGRLTREMFGENNGEPRVQANARNGAGIFLPPGTEGLLPRILEKIQPPLLAIKEKNSPLRMAHRRTLFKHDFFVINDSAQPWKGSVGVILEGRHSSGLVKSEIWNPTSAKIEPIADENNIPINLGPYESLLLRLPTMNASRHAVLKTGNLPGLTMKPIPSAEPMVTGGEFVKKSVAADTSRKGVAWRAIGDITKSNVDTHLFTRLMYPQGAQLEGAEFVVLDSWVPKGQTSSAQVLVILHEKGGGDYLASSGRALGVPGFNRSYIPIHRFTLAGWTKDANQKLDLAEVTEIRIGWGGYFGVQGERVEFSFTIPQVVLGEKQ